MDTITISGEDPEQIAAQLLRLSPHYAETPLLDLPSLAAHFNVAQLLVKDEGRRTLGSFKSLGGTYAGLRALARASNVDLPSLLSEGRSRGPLPTLITASAGNHGLAVAAAAKFAGGRARIYLYADVAPTRVRRIEAQGAEIVWVEGTYDDAVDRAQAAADAGEGILVADTSIDPVDPAVGDVLAGYGVLASEIRKHVHATGHLRPTHLFVQAGVGGLAAAMMTGLKAWLADPGMVVVVEPEKAACVGLALLNGHSERVSGDLATSAGMLACGEASAPALQILQQGAAQAVTVSEAELGDAVTLLRARGGPETTPSGAAGLAGLAAVAANPGLSSELALDETSRVLLIVTETDLERDV
ncbi:pyridoxal-phosphate dependent enzyme [Microvirga alba]|uniref:Pyridoxal-phosphate dependent enzyme n=1 Tax=Microvirga alba TaxID=2791025 RepID=A0A931BQ14_9HYPH|nr:pyridoxal-phosphate dependent enzyme [Microvirga alba]MBF9235351.1 pyridoxal-phosphate dependent enzyme [Microvirga alba]